MSENAPPPPPPPDPDPSPDPTPDPAPEPAPDSGGETKSWATFSGSIEYGKVSNTLGYYWSGIYGIKFAFVSPLETSITLGAKLAVVGGRSVSWVIGIPGTPLGLGGTYNAGYTQDYTAYIGRNYSQTIKGTGFKNVQESDTTLGGTPISSDVATGVMPEHTQIIGGMPILIPAAPTYETQDTGTTADYKKKDVKFEVYYGNTYKWIKGGKYEREGVDPANDIATPTQIYINDTGSKTNLANYLYQFATTKAAADKRTADTKLAAQWYMKPDQAAWSCADIALTSPAPQGGQAGQGKISMFAKTREATIGSSTAQGSCTETINGTKKITSTVGSTAGLELAGSKASLIAGTAGISMTTAKVTIGPKVDLGMPVPAVSAAGGDQAPPPVDLNQALQDMQSKFDELENEGWVVEITPL